MTDPYITKLLEMQNRILERQAKALEDIAAVLKNGNINVEARTIVHEKLRSFL